MEKFPVGWRHGIAIGDLHDIRTIPKKLDMRVIEARESVRAAVLALPRTIPWGDVADAAGVTHATLRRFVRTPEKTRIETVTAIAAAVEKIRARKAKQ